MVGADVILALAIFPAEITAWGRRFVLVDMGVSFRAQVSPGPVYITSRMVSGYWGTKVI
jgi:hypothetical protein